MKDLKGFSNYTINRNAEITNKKTGLVRKNQLNKELGYYQIALYSGNKQTVKYIHRLVAEHFIPNPHNLPEVNHIDSNRLNNSVSNLEWVDSRANSLHAVGMGRRDHVSRMSDKDIEDAYNLVIAGYNYTEISEKMNNSWKNGFLSVKVKKYAERNGLLDILNKELKRQQANRARKNLKKINGV